MSGEILIETCQNEGCQHNCAVYRSQQARGREQEAGSGSIEDRQVCTLVAHGEGARVVVAQLLVKGVAEGASFQLRLSEALFRYRPKGVFGKGVGNRKNASEIRQKCVKMGLVLLGKQERSKMRQKCVKIASKMRQQCAEPLWGRAPLGRYRLLSGSDSDPHPQPPSSLAKDFCLQPCLE